MEFTNHLNKLIQFLSENHKHIYNLEKDNNKINYIANIAKILDHLSIPVFNTKLSAYPDIKKKEYEGGFKIWECELDGTRFILEDNEYFNNIEGKCVLEIGCGSGLMGYLIRSCVLC